MRDKHTLEIKVHAKRILRKNYVYCEENNVWISKSLCIKINLSLNFILHELLICNFQLSPHDFFGTVSLWRQIHECISNKFMENRNKRPAYFTVFAFYHVEVLQKLLIIISVLSRS